MSEQNSISAEKDFNFILSKSDFCHCISLIREQEEADKKFSKALSLVGDGHFIYGANNKVQKALFFVLQNLSCRKGASVPPNFFRYPAMCVQ